MVRAVVALILVIAMVHVATAQLQGDECPENMEWKSCGTACPRTCANRFGPIGKCIQQCVTGCHCKAGYVLTQYGKDGRCVQPNEC